MRQNKRSEGYLFGDEELLQHHGRLTAASRSNFRNRRSLKAVTYGHLQEDDLYDLENFVD